VSQKAWAAERAIADSKDFVGMTKEEIDDEHHKYVHYHEDVTVTQRDEHCSRKRCYRALEELNKLIPGFEEKANAAEDVNIYCIPVCHSHNLITSDLILIGIIIKLQSGANDARSDDTGN